MTTSWDSQIPDAYVKFVEQSGARVVPIIYKYHSEEEVTDLLGKINGIILPGGSGDADYKAWEKKIFKQVLKKNDGGVHFPIMGICLGMQYITKHIAKDSKLYELHLTKTPKTITFLEKGFEESKLFSSDLLEFTKSDFENEVAFYHQHKWGISPYMWEKEKALSDELRILSTETAIDGREFVNIYEGIRYPILGFQFHPEKATSAMSRFNPFPHQNKAVYLNRFFADYFVNEARKNS